MKNTPISPPPCPCPPENWRRHGVVFDLHGQGRPFVQNFTSPSEFSQDGRWRIWYSLLGLNQELANIGIAEGNPGQSFQRCEAALNPGESPGGRLTIGNLPENWFPTQPVHLHLLDGRHRLYFWAHGPGVLRYLAAESDDGYRYRVLDPHRACLYHRVDRACAKPGNEPSVPPHLISNDATTVYQLPDGSFEMFSVGLVPVGKDDRRYVSHDNVAGLLRVIDRYTSADGICWPDRRRVMEPDGDDPIDLQFYHLAVTYTPQGRVGLLGHYRVDAQTMDIEWCFSTDGLKWRRPQRRAWLKRGAEGQGDSYGIYPPHSLVLHDNKWWLFYTGVNYAHNMKHAHGEPRSVIMLATSDSIWG